jgi:nucleotide-binding universal stress UspA family protein
MKTILVPTDFSRAAQHAAEFAVPLAQLTEARIVFLNVIQPVPDAYNIPMSSSQLMAAQEENAEIAMEKFKENLWVTFSNNIEHFPEIETKVIYGGVSSTIIEMADNYKAEFIVMGSVGTNSTLDKLMGSNTVRVAKNAHCPVWVIPKKTKLLAIKSLVYATDLQGEEVEVLNKIVNIAEVLGASVKALYIHEEFEPEVYSSKEIIEQIKEGLHEKPVIFKDLQREDVIKGLDNYIKNQNPDVVVLAHEERSFMEKLFHHSVIKHFTLTAKTPLLILQKNW